MNCLDQVLFGQEIPDFECSSSGYETTIFTPLNRSSYFYPKELAYSATSSVLPNYVDLSNPKSASSFSVLSRELCTKLWGQLKNKRTNYERLPQFDKESFREQTNGSHDAHERCFNAQRPLRNYCEEELCPMVIYQNSISDEPPMDSQLYSMELETTPKSPTPKNIKWSLRGKLRHAPSKNQSNISAQDTRAKRRYKRVRELVKEFCNSCFHSCNRKSHTESSSDDGLSKLWQEYNQAYSDALNETYKSLDELRACFSWTFEKV